MPTLDIAMPLALLVVVTLAVFLNKRAEGKLKASLEEKEFQTRDILMLVVTMVIVISIIAATTILNPDNLTNNVLLAVFLGFLHNAAIHFQLHLFRTKKIPSTIALYRLWNRKHNCRRNLPS